MNDTLLKYVCWLRAGSQYLELLVVAVVLPGRVVQLLVVRARGVVRDAVHVGLVAVHAGHVGRPLEHHLEQRCWTLLYQALL